MAFAGYSGRVGDALCRGSGRRGAAGLGRGRACRHNRLNRHRRPQGSRRMNREQQEAAAPTISDEKHACTCAYGNVSVSAHG